MQARGSGLLTSIRLSQYGIGTDKIPTIVEQLKAHGMTALSETQDVTLDVSQKILERAM
jgi:NADP-dependent alcohol dehydrogenase